MLKIKILIIFFVFTLSLTSCQSFKSAIVGEKKSKGEEFLIIKKEPLTLPPEFNELPEPAKSENNDTEEIETVEIKNILKSSKSINSETLSSPSKSLENSVLDKIKKK